ncbi:hypothetical protein GC425_03570 [Corynebacterium sp. zg254]|uniref:Metallopeptidase family protein n=1 Tax=Corynebacterium zhongnanshanii TaxID=2768834 RepID=A0ABQ6VFH1_9CORY|nr:MULTISPECIES: metallopeptidase family protein [Corynebacterium]KAB3522969.1 metallopeptidase family protein [Corynebacterium zhongnanshanii]MCR5913948.1 hypothetical protein [Corynebacterium sp. zg254]
MAQHISRSRNDPRGRGLRGVLLPDLPRYKTRSQRFDNAVIDAYEPYLEHFRSELGALDIAVDIVPRMRLSHGASTWPEDVVADGAVPLGRLVPAGVDRQGRPTRPRIIVFRRPVELRTSSPQELEQMLRHIIVRLVAVYLNTVPEAIDPRFTWDV